MSASVGLRPQLMMDHEDNYQEMKAARSSTQLKCCLLRNYGGGEKNQNFPRCINICSLRWTVVMSSIFQGRQYSELGD